jgi:hypothetical protein
MRVESEITAAVEIRNSALVIIDFVLHLGLRRNLPHTLSTPHHTHSEMMVSVLAALHFPSFENRHFRTCKGNLTWHVEKFGFYGLAAR